MNIEGKVKVSTTQLKAKADEVSKLIKQYRSCYERMEQRINGTKSYWIGEAGDLHRKLFNDKKERMDKMFRRLEEHPRDLLTMAGVYENVEREVQNIALSLDGDVIE